MNSPKRIRLHVEVLGERIAPAVTANPDAYTLTQGTSYNSSVSVLANDTDSVVPAMLSATVESGPSNGTLSMMGLGTFIYQPYANFHGTDYFIYRASHLPDYATATVTLTVTPSGGNQAPIAMNDSYTVAQDQPLVVNAPGVLTNDTDMNGDTLTVVAHSSALYGGTITLSNTGALTYVPPSSFVGTDSFTYTASDGVATANATVSITVTAAANLPTVSIRPSVEFPAITEGAAGTAQFTVSRSNINQNAHLVVHYVVSAPSGPWATGVADPGQDYTAVGLDATARTGTATIAAGQTTATIHIDPTNDTFYEGNENVRVWLVEQTTYTIEPLFSEASVTINEDAGDTGTQVSISTTEPYAYEASYYPGVMYITREGPVNEELTVRYDVATGQGHATPGLTDEPGNDYQILSNTVIFEENQRSVRVSVRPFNDAIQELDETVRVTLTLSFVNPYDIKPGAGVGIVTIKDNDMVVSVTAHDGSAAEALQDRGTFRFSRTGAAAQITAPFTVSYSVSGTAIPSAGTTPNDYTALPGTITIPANQSFVDVDVIPTDDNDPEPTKSVFVTLVGGWTYSTHAADYWARVDITDNDTYVGGPMVAGNLTASRPYTRYLSQTYVPEAQEHTPAGGAGIRRNGDDDDNDGTADRVDNNGVIGDDDLIPVQFYISHTQPQLAAINRALVLKRTNASINVWSDANKTTPLLTTQGEYTFTDQSPIGNSGIATVYVEWVDMAVTGTESFLDLFVRDTTTQQLIAPELDRVRFYPFNSIVIGFVGEGQSPWNITTGMHQMVRTLYDRGYDARLYDEDDMGNDIPAPGVRAEPEYASYYAVRNAVVNRGVKEVAIFGYSHGAGATHRLAGWVAGWSIPGVTLKFTGYIDGITKGNVTPEIRRPPGSQWHYNFWQSGFDFHYSDTLRGGNMGANADVNDDVEVAGGAFRADAIHGSDATRGIAELLDLRNLLLGIVGDNGIMDKLTSR